MNPAYSILFFTVSSGAGYGLLALLGLVGFNHGQASSTAFALTCIVVALALITAGLLSSTAHLGRPERAWRAFSQWRSSWLSREGLAAIITYPVALLFGLAWAGWIAAPIGVLGLLTFACSVVTVFCTGQIYATLKTIRAWKQPLTVPVYLAFAIATGAVILAALAASFGRYQPAQTIIACIALATAAVLKLFYWRSIDSNDGKFNMAQATGLGGDVRQWEVPHTSTNFVMKEMGYAVARKHAQRLRMLVLAGLAASIVISILAWLANPLISWIAVPTALAASFVERWLYFAEAEHVSSLFYGNPSA